MSEQALALFDSVASSIAFSVVLAAALFYAWRAYRQPYLGYWAGFWGLYVVVWSLYVVAYGDPVPGRHGWSIAALGLASVASFTARTLGVVGTLAYLGRPLPGRRAWRALAAAIALAVALGTLARWLALEGLAPAWAPVPFRTYFLGGIVYVWIAAVLVRSGRAGGVAVVRLLAVAFAAAALSDAWDVALELLEGVGWAGAPPVALRLSALAAHVCDALFATGMMFAAIGTERRRAEEAAAELRARDAQLQEAQRLETVGQLAGGLAHDFNNLLTAIIGNLSFLRDRFPADDPAREDVEAASGAAARAAKLTRQLLIFARRQSVEPRNVDLNQRVHAVEHMLVPLLGERIRRRLALEPGLWPVRVDPSQLEQLLVNLVVNARDAMPGGGTLLLETANEVLGPGSRPPDGEGVPDGEWVRLSVEDTGTGMDEAVRARIFEPFFTTKGPGVGSGLGLATVHGIVHQAQGHVAVRSAPGAGARFSVWLPRQHGAPEAPFTPAPPVSHGREVVLLVEDDPEVRTALARALAARGYEVIAATGGEEALARCGAQAERVDIAVTDVVMPGMDGRALAKELWSRRRGLPVLFVTGYAPGGLEDLGAVAGPSGVLAKPFTPELLAARVRELLDATPAAA